MKSKTIVIVEDDAGVTKVLERILGRRGYNTLKALDGKSGLEMIILTRPDAVLLDIRMPILQGYDVCRYIRSRWELRGTKVIVCSGLGLPSDIEWARSAGADDYLIKPFEEDELLEKLDRHLSSGR